MFTKGIFVFCVIISFTQASSYDLPSNFPRCKRYDPDLTDCLLKASETVKPYLIKGVPSLGIPSIDPFIVSEMTLEQNTTLLNFTAHFTNVSAKGLSSYKFSQFDFDVPHKQWFFKCSFIDQVIELDGTYNVTGKVLSAPIVGKGTFVASISNLSFTGYHTFKIIKKKGDDYVYPLVTNVTISGREPKTLINGLFAGDEKAGQIMNKAISDNVNELFEDLKPIIEKVVSKISEEWLFRGFEGKVPFKKLYPTE